MPGPGAARVDFSTRGDVGGEHRAQRRRVRLTQVDLETLVVDDELNGLRSGRAVDFVDALRAYSAAQRLLPHLANSHHGACNKQRIRFGQTGSNFGAALRHATPFLCSVSADTRGRGGGPRQVARAPVY